MFKPVILTTDFLFFLLLVSMMLFFWWARSKQHMRVAAHQLVRSRFAMVALLILIVYLMIAFLDSLHFQVALPSNGQTQQIHYQPQIESVLDRLLAPLKNHSEKTYSAPFAVRAFVKETVEKADGTMVRAYPRLRYGGNDLAKVSERSTDILKRVGVASVFAEVIFIAFSVFFFGLVLLRNKITVKDIWQQRSGFPWRVTFSTVFVLLWLLCLLGVLSQEYHVFGTNKVGTDVLYLAIKSIRTGLLIGTLTTLVMLPFALLLGVMAGYFGGVIDDIIQYLYTTLSSIPGVLLIAASILSLQIFIANHPDWFPTLADRADARLLALCLILGVTSWTGLCRLLRGETLKLREVDYIQASRALGSGHFKILMKHVLPNVMHIVLIAIALDFSMLVLAEAVLSYVGVGVDPTAISWGNMINSARLELAREPVVWWPLLAAFVFMFILVLSANLFADALRDSLDPRIRKGEQNSKITQ